MEPSTGYPNTSFSWFSGYLQLTLVFLPGDKNVRLFLEVPVTKIRVSAPAPYKNPTVRSALSLLIVSPVSCPCPPHRSSLMHCFWPFAGHSHGGKFGGNLLGYCAHLLQWGAVAVCPPLASCGNFLAFSTFRTEIVPYSHTLFSILKIKKAVGVSGGVFSGVLEENSRKIPGNFRVKLSCIAKCFKFQDSGRQEWLKLGNASLFTNIFSHFWCPFCNRPLPTTKVMDFLLNLY